jgi:prolyl-tRNA editing enzyme YbaK/EbsC (Cys-tRNA(Pro) deacylase)
VEGLPVVAVGGGARGVNVHLAPGDLVRATSGELLAISNPDPSPPHAHDHGHE